MSERYEIPKSYIPAEIQTATVGLVAFFLFITASQIVRAVDSLIPADTSSLSLIIRISALVIAVLAVMATWVNNTRRHYYIEANSLIIENSGVSGRKAQEIITPKHAPRIELTSSFFGNHFGYGDIVITVDSYSDKSRHELKNILDPEAVVKELRARL
ncbi:MAG: hypothetical protein QG659_487 [Patescibacteria group bacterium]|jgi:hypothetical protein|nr:hypothetical protein [Patescibacteria group bacterium]HMS24052.1 hypothetical protein [Candidatus Saccharibacteria bacterium]